MNNNAKYFIVDKKNNCIECYTDDVDGGMEGYKLKLQYVHNVGYSWELSQFKSGNSVIQQKIEDNPESFTKHRFTAFILFGVCPKCSDKLLDGFNWSLHDVQKCGSPKRAVAPRSEWA